MVLGICSEEPLPYALAELALPRLLQLSDLNGHTSYLRF
jgi:hypothetical protein